MPPVGHPLDMPMLETNLQAWREWCAGFAESRARSVARRHWLFFQGHAEYALNVAAISYLQDVSLSEVLAVLRPALRELLMVSELGGAIEEPHALFGATLLVRDADLVRWFAHLPTRSDLGFGVTVSDAWFLSFGAAQAAASGDDTRYAAAVAELAPAVVLERLVVKPKDELARYTPLLQLHQALLVRDQQAFDAAWAARQKDWKKRYGRAAERANPEGILDYELLGLGRVALDRGLAVPSVNPYAPLPLLQAATPG